MVRKYVVEGPRVSFDGIHDEQNPLFEPLGLEDEEFFDFKLVSQQVEPSNTIDKAYLTRTYVEFKPTYISESLTTQGGIKTLTRRFAVLRDNNEEIGYDNLSWALHPINGTNSDPWDFLPVAIEQNNPKLLAYPGYEDIPWMRKNVSVLTNQNGVDIWSVSWFVPYEPTGRPKVQIDSKTGFEKITRQFYVPKYLADDRDSELYTTFKTGAADLVNGDHFLVDLNVEPSKDGDISLLTAVYLKLKPKHYFESYKEAGDFIRIVKKFAVLRNEDEAFGYGQFNDSEGNLRTPWNYHPANPEALPTSSTWDYAPKIVSLSAPKKDEDAFENADSGGFSETTKIDGVNTAQFLQDADLVTGDWLPGGISVAQSSNGLDVWSIEWVTHVKSFWRTGATSVTSSSNSSLTEVSFDEYGLKLESGGSSGSSTTATKTKTFTTYHIGTDVPEQLSVALGGTSNGASSSNVLVDITITLAKTQKEITYKQNIQKAAFRKTTAANINFKDSNNQNVKVASGENLNEYQFNYIADTAGAGSGSGSAPISHVNKPLFQNQPIDKIVGRISWTATTTFINSDGSVSNPVTTSTITPIFSQSGTKIWRIEITYVGQ